MGFFLNLSNKNMTVGGVRQLIEFGNEEIELKIQNKTLKIAGEKLVIERFDENEIIISAKTFSRFEFL